MVWQHTGGLFSVISSNRRDLASPIRGSSLLFWKKHRNPPPCNVYIKYHEIKIFRDVSVEPEISHLFSDRFWCCGCLYFATHGSLLGKRCGFVGMDFRTRIGMGESGTGPTLLISAASNYGSALVQNWPPSGITPTPLQILKTSIGYLWKATELNACAIAAGLSALKYRI